MIVPSATTQETHIPITQWNIPPTSQPITAEQESVSQYFSLSSELANQNAGSKEAANQEQTHWSRWVLVDLSRPRLPVAVPVSFMEPYTVGPVCCVKHVKEQQLYVEAADFVLTVQ